MDKAFDFISAASVHVDEEVPTEIYDEEGRIDHIAMALDAEGDVIVSFVNIPSPCTDLIFSS